MTQTDSNQSLCCRDAGLSKRSMAWFALLYSAGLGTYIGLVQFYRYKETWQTSLISGVRSGVCFMIPIAAVFAHIATRVMPAELNYSPACVKQVLAELFRPSPTLWLALLSFPAAAVLYHVLACF